MMKGTTDYVIPRSVATWESPAAHLKLWKWKLTSNILGIYNVNWCGEMTYCGAGDCHVGAMLLLAMT